MKKKTIILISALVVIAMLFGACGAADTAKTTASPSPSASDDKVIVAEMDGQSIYMNEFVDWLNQNVQGGADILQNVTTDQLKSILDSFIAYKVEQIELQKLGYMNLTGDQATQVQKNVEDNLSNYELQSGMTEQQALDYMGITKDQLIDLFKFDAAEKNAYSDAGLVGNTTPSDAEIKTAYDTNVASDKQQMDADPTVYVSNVDDGTPVYYIPAGVRMIKRVLIALDADTTGAISTLRDAGYDAQADVLLKDGLSKIQSKADNVSQLIKTGKTSFSDAVTQYNEDKDMSPEGYPVVTGTSVYADAFTQKALALASVGDVSDMFSTDDGYQIIEYTKDATQGAVSLDNVKDVIIGELQPAKQSDAWNAVVDKWKVDHKAKAFYENL